MNKFILFFILAITAGCYRMPEDGEVSVLPNTNNPNVTRQGDWSPGIEY